MLAGEKSLNHPAKYRFLPRAILISLTGFRLAYINLDGGDFVWYKKKKNHSSQRAWGWSHAIFGDAKRSKLYFLLCHRGFTECNLRAYSRIKRVSVLRSFWNHMINIGEKTQGPWMVIGDLKG